MKSAIQYDWSLLNRDCSDIVKGVLAKWQVLVLTDEREPLFQHFLAEHAGLFFGMDGTCLTISQLQLGTELRPDLVVAHDMRSGGVLYEFIELKRPSHSPYTAAGVPSQYLTKALAQVECYRARLKENCTEIRERLPASHAANRRCLFTIIIGRRGNTKEWLSKRNQLSVQYDVKVRSYDSLTDQLAGRQFAPLCPPYWVGADEPTLNQLANPFTKAFTDKSWRTLVQRVQNATPDGLAVFNLHFLSCAAEQVVKCLKHNALFDEFRKGQASIGVPTGK